MCAPWELDHQLQRHLGGINVAAGVFILTEDCNVTHLGAPVGTVLGGYVTKKGRAFRAAAAQVESDTVKRCLRAALLGTDYSGNKPVVRAWKDVDCVAAELYAAIGGGEIADLSSSGVLNQLCHVTAQRLRDTTITEDSLVADVVTSALMFQQGPVSALVFGVDVVTVQQRQAAFFAGQSTVKGQPLNPVPDSASQGRAWRARHFELGVQHDERGTSSWACNTTNLRFSGLSTGPVMGSR